MNSLCKDYYSYIKHFNIEKFEWLEKINKILKKGIKHRSQID